MRWISGKTAASFPITFKPMQSESSRHLNKQETWNRRQFIGGALGMATSAVSLATLSALAADTPPPEAKPAQFTGLKS
jgi:hypothetical protein